MIYVKILQHISSHALVFLVRFISVRPPNSEFKFLRTLLSSVLIYVSWLLSAAFIFC